MPRPLNHRPHDAEAHEARIAAEIERLAALGALARPSLTRGGSCKGLTHLAPAERRRRVAEACRAGGTVETVAALHGVSQSYVDRACRRHGVKPRLGWGKTRAAKH